MIRRLQNKPLIRPEDLQPTDDRLRVVSAFNPGVIDTPNGVVILVRVAEAVAEQRDGFTALPRWEGGSIAIDWPANDQLRPVDPRVVEMRDGRTRLTFTSHLRIVTSPDGLKIDPQALAAAPRIDPVLRYELFGVEDPRITRIDDRYWITYVAVSPHGACTALASTEDFTRFERHGIVFPSENKDVTLFPRKIGGRYVALHRPNPRTHFSPPEMWLATSDNLTDWGTHTPIDVRVGDWSAGRIGGGCPPIETDRGWLVIYHGNDKTASADEAYVGRYFGAALLLDRDDPGRVIAHSDGPIMAPETEYERVGFVPNVVFPTGAVANDDKLLVYYGAADTSTAVVEWSMTELLDRLRS